MFSDCDLRSVGMLRSMDLVVIDVLGQPIGPIFKGQTVQEECREHTYTVIQRMLRAVTGSQENVRQVL